MTGRITSKQSKRRSEITTAGWQTHQRLKAILLGLAVLFSIVAQGQSPHVVLRGRVLDPSRAAIVGASVTATPDGSGPVVSAVSDAAGGYSLALAPGSYTLRAVAEGFEEDAQRVILSGADATRDVVLSVAARRDVIVVSETADYQAVIVSSATKAPAALLDVPQAVTVVTRELARDQGMASISDVVRYVPGITAAQGEGNRDQLVIRGNNTTADFFVNGVRDDTQYYRDLYNLERVEALKGPNALIFGRGGAGGVINRVTKEAGFAPLREATLQLGSYNNRRFATDFDHPLGDRLAFRINGMYENSGSFRRDVELARYGISPTFTFTPGADTKLTVGYEHFYDRRTPDRGIPSFQGLPSDVATDAFVGNPDDARSKARVNFGTVAVEQQMGRATLRNRLMVGDYDKFYQNYVPGVLSADQSTISVSAYNNGTVRRNIFNQTDLGLSAATGPVRHALVVGVEVGRQTTDNLRTTGFFNNSSTAISVPSSDPVVTAPTTFRPNATDADNDVATNVAAVYFQDQVELSRWVRVIAGVRLDHFDLDYSNHRNSEMLGRVDNMISPRAGLIVKPLEAVSLYASYSVSHLPSSGDQFSSLNTVTQTLKPERFNNYELGAKWDARRDLSFTAAAYRLDRTNTRSADPNDPTRILQTGSQRSDGAEIEISGSITSDWRLMGGYSYQDARITSATDAAPAGREVAQVPHHSFSLWNHYRFLPKWSAGLGIIHRADMFVAIDNTVVLPAYTRADAAIYYTLSEKVRVQANIENLFDNNYFISAHSNNNISPGSPIAVRLGITTRF
jgi:catecholate siderophore receptor